MVNRQQLKLRSAKMTADFIDLLRGFSVGKTPVQTDRNQNNNAC
jgi:hypothetical protein